MALDLLWASWERSDQGEECSLGGSFPRKPWEAAWLCLSEPLKSLNPPSAVFSYSQLILGLSFHSRKEDWQEHTSMWEAWLISWGRKRSFETNNHIPPYIFLPLQGNFGKEECHQEHCRHFSICYTWVQSLHLPFTKPNVIYKNITGLLWEL